MNKPVTIVCNYGCGKEFTAKIVDKKLGEGVLKHMLKCPYCGKEYRIFYSNIKSRRLRQRIKDQKNTLTQSERKDLLTEINQIEHDIQSSIEG